MTTLPRFKVDMSHMIGTRYGAPPSLRWNRFSESVNTAEAAGSDAENRKSRKCSCQCMAKIVPELRTRFFLGRLNKFGRGGVVVYTYELIILLLLRDKSLGRSKENGNTIQY